MTKPVVKIAYTNMWKEFDPDDIALTRIFRVKYDVRQVPLGTDEDVCIVSCFGPIQRPPTKAPVIGMLGESYQVKGDEPYADIYFTINETRNKNIYWPHWLNYIDNDEVYDTLQKRNARKYEKTRFCSFIARHPGFYGDHTRLHFTQFIMKEYKHVDCPSELLNNHPPIGDAVTQLEADNEKVEFLQRYKFNIAFENCVKPYYVTEKIVQPFKSNCIPIYRGGIKALDDFNEKAFIYAGEGADLTDFAATLSQIKRIDENDDLFYEMVSQPVFKADIREKYSYAKHLEIIERRLWS
jgi:alpha(1,3/1,4) fucosyltransferase